MRGALSISISAILALLCMTACRYAFFRLNNFELVDNPPLQSMMVGFRFDLSVVCCWLLPVIFLELFYAIKKTIVPKICVNFKLFYLRFGLAFIAFICIADIYFYQQFATHINASILNWIETPNEMFGMLWHEKIYRLGILYLFIAIVVLLFLHIYLLKNRKNKPSANHWGIAIHSALMLLVFFGIRGGIRATPLNMKDANVSEHYFFNQLAMNPVYNLYNSLTENTESLGAYNSETETEVMEMATQYLDTTSTISTSSKTKPNVVFILMESMASFKLNRTPFLNSLIKKSIYFDSFYSSGEHTYNGIFSSFYGEASIPQKHMLRWMEYSENKGIPGMFKNQGYFNIFHIPHTRYFDNMGNFLWRHSFDSVVDKVNVPKDLEGGSKWGTADHNILAFAIRNMDELVKKKKPIFNAILTISDHQPFLVPTGQNIPIFKGELKDQLIGYADWSLQKFFEVAKTKSWYKNTVFILVADHGHMSGKEDFPLPISFHHIPLLIYKPGAESKAKRIHGLGAQPDISPTLAAYLGLPYLEHPLSNNLFKTNRNFVYFTSDNYAGYLEQGKYFILGNSNEKYAFDNGGKAIPTEPFPENFKNLLNLSRYAALRLDKAKKKK